MTITKRFTFGIATFLGLFGANQVIHIQTSRARSEQLKVIDRALSRQEKLAAIRQQLDNLNKQIVLVTQLQVEDSGAAANPEARKSFTQSLRAMEVDIKAYKELVDAVDRNQLDQFQETYVQLAQAWEGFYQFFGVDQGTAMSNLIKAEPLAKQLLEQILPRMQENERVRVKQAQAEFLRLENRTNNIIWLIFGIVTLPAIVVAVLTSRYFTSSIVKLKEGTSLIGHGMLEHRITLDSKDELGDLAKAFNEMAANVTAARENVVQAHRELEQRNVMIEEQQKLRESLLLNILPTQVANELEEKGHVDPKYFEDVTIIFTDFVGFTLSTEHLAAEELVRLLHQYFTAFDRIVAHYRLEKLKTIGDSYMCVGGLPERRPSHPVDAVMAAFDLLNYVQEQERVHGSSGWSMRIGIHTGPVVAGVVGIQKFAFDIWGESVNFASRVETAGIPNQINLSSATYMRVKDFIECEHRGKVMISKERKEVDMYLAKGVLPTLLDDTGSIPPLPFEKRYRTYFQKEPEHFPKFLAKPRILLRSTAPLNPS